ncbi:MAG: TraU family protein [Hydrogenophaga sp.]
MTRRLLSGRLMNLGLRALLCLLLGVGSVQTQVNAQTPSASVGTNTAGVVAATMSAAPSCLSYRVTGICFFLRCTPFGCTVETSIRVSHYMPDVVVSTYNDQYGHPWTDVGSFVSGIGSSAGTSLLRSPIDASASTANPPAERPSAEPVATFKSADAIGNPLVIVNNVSNEFVVPGVSELMDFPGTMGSILREWAQAPATLMSYVPAQVQSWMRSGANLMSTVQNVAGQVGNVSSSINSLSSIGGSQAPGSTETIREQVAGLREQLEGAAAASGGSSDLLCPSSASALGVYFQSDLDSYFWRDWFPMDLVYVGSWLPGMHEVSHTPLVSTWGNTYPRSGNLIQQHSVKASAVYASRVASIIRQRAQPHIYSHLRPRGTMAHVWFAQVADPRWSMVHPFPSGCVRFGSNDSLSLVSYGDGRTTSNHSHIWNLWHRYECCRRRTEIFLFAVP